MSPEERQLLTDLFTRTQAAAAGPRDRDAEALVEQATRAQPAAAYYLAQAVIVQEKALAAAAERLHALEAQIETLERAGSQQQTASSGGFLGSIFGSPSTAASETPPPGPWSRTSAARSYAPAPQTPPPQQAYGGPWGGGQPQQQASASGGFLRGALGTAAGVAGGMLLATSISGLFGGHSGLAGIGSPFGAASQPGTEVIEETVVNNYYGDDAGRQTAASDTDTGDDGLQQADFDNDAGGFDDGDSFA